MESIKNQLFAAANSGRGFANFYNQVFAGESIERKYLIKGGPGTGKSSFMKKISTKASEKGYSVEFYNCSSDPSSLDAVVIEGRVALMDATSPHSVECELAGARDNIVDLGAFWNSDGLEENIEQIKRLSAQKSSNYATAYAFLGSAMALEDEARRLSNMFTNHEKLETAVKRLVKKMPGGEKYELKTGLCNSIGMRGQVRFDTYERSAAIVYYIDDFYKTGSLLLSMLASEGMKKGCKMRISYEPLDPTHPDALYFEACNTAFVLREKKSEPTEENKEKIYKYINMKRFVDFGCAKMSKKQVKTIRNEYKTAIRFCEALVEEAATALKNAGEAHFELEKIYVKNMDFAAQSRFTDNFVEELIEYLDRK